MDVYGNKQKCLRYIHQRFLHHHFRRLHVRGDGDDGDHVLRALRVHARANRGRGLRLHRDLHQHFLRCPKIQIL
jgi:hypothetical protein